MRDGFLSLAGFGYPKHIAHTALPLYFMPLLVPSSFRTGSALTDRRFLCVNEDFSSRNVSSFNCT